MRTVQPCIIIGSYVWDQDRVPRDEFQIRIGALNGLMDANGWKAVLVYGDAAEHSALAWFSGFTTRLRWGMALIPGEGAIGSVGFELMRPPLFASLQKSLGNRFGLQAADEAVAGVRTMRPRELS